MGCDGFANRLKIILETKTAATLSKECGFRQSLLHKYMEGSIPGMEKVVAISAAANVTIKWLATGEGPMQDNYEDVISVPIYNLYTKAQDFENNSGSEELISFSRSWLKNRLRVQETSLSLIDVNGDEVSPIERYDIALVDRSNLGCTPNDGIFVLKMFKSLVLKRVKLVSGLVVEHTESDTFCLSPEIVDKYDKTSSDGYKILGRVVWFGRRI